MLTLKNVSVTIHNKTILHNISCTINTGDFVIIVGPNGAGKSTFFDMITGRRLPSSGSIIIDGTDITQLNEQQRAPFISRLFQDTHLNGVSSMTIAENLSIACYKNSKVTFAQGLQRFHAIPKTTLASLQLTDNILNRPLRSLSGGQRQLIAFIMATLIPPKLFLLDEPTAALDPGAATRLLSFATDYIRQHHMTTLLITHDQHLARVLGNKVWVLEHGTIIKQIEGEEKATIAPENLIGHIDYEQLMLHSLDKQ